MTTQATKTAQSTIKVAKANIIYYKSVLLDIESGKITLILPEMRNLWLRNCDTMIRLNENQIETFEVIIAGSELKSALNN